ncbi:SAF domain-containing protein [Vallitalea guaymasensis]|uniref:SAF domain-containing protein n=1 Tax=Vallitalea guaymasensis TaxID=1185412 RepID=A0A8J8SBY7_9FIRM|nr:SAF domain-containing protein [Vallitalea guaymasensis]QUH29182.1 SAF domain-containing protein [Vallitalea guaymasensis]
MKNFMKGLMGIILIVIAIGSIFYWEVYGRESLLFKDIVVLTKDVNKNEVITKDMVQIQKREENTLIDKVILDPNKIIGKAANNYIPKGVQLVEKYFENPNLVLDEDEYIFKIPLEWIKAFPDSLRRGDEIYFYEVGKGTENYNSTEGEIAVNNKKALEKDPITNATVAYVKDSANREVITLSDEERYNGSSKINEIEIITDLETVNLLRDSVNNDKVFIIMYQ